MKCTTFRDDRHPGFGAGDVRKFRCWAVSPGGSVAKIFRSYRARDFGSPISLYPCWIAIRSSSAPCSNISSLIMSGPMPKARSTRRTSLLMPGWSWKARACLFLSARNASMNFGSPGANDSETSSAGASGEVRHSAGPNLVVFIVSLLCQSSGVALRSHPGFIGFATRRDRIICSASPIPTTCSSPSTHGRSSPERAVFVRTGKSRCPARWQSSIRRRTRCSASLAGTTGLSPIAKRLPTQERVQGRHSLKPRRTNGSSCPRTLRNPEATATSISPTGPGSSTSTTSWSASGRRFRKPMARTFA